MKKVTLTFIVDDTIADEVKNELGWGEMGNAANFLNKNCEESDYDVADYKEGDEKTDDEDDPLEGCSEDFRKGMAYVMEQMDEDDKAIIRAKVNKCYKQNIIPDENSVDDSKITDLLEEYGEDNDLPEGWYLDEYDAYGILQVFF